jgi:hypothetical protein
MKLGATLAAAARTRRGVPALLAGIAAIALAFYAAFGGLQTRPASAAVPGFAVAASVLHRLDAIAVRAARRNGAAQFEWATAVMTTQARALTSAAPGITEPIGAGALVYLITMKGRFTAVGASLRPGSTGPTASYLSLVVNARTFAVTVFHLSRKAPAVSPASLGPLRYLQR